jgi:16S rRNA (cytidine1402-2'-O)-methyltransferase
METENRSIVYLIPSFLADNALASITPATLTAVQSCKAFFVEDERTARRFLKAIWKEMVIDDYQWTNIHKAEAGMVEKFVGAIRKGMNVGILSEAGCPGIADPGQILVDAAHRAGAIVRPVVGPNSIVLALMGSGLNGQRFQFNGYLPIDNTERIRAIRELEKESQAKNCTQIFIETPYRNVRFAEELIRTLGVHTRLCIATDLTSESELITTKTVGEWKKSKAPEIHKKPSIFMFLA